MEARRHTLSSFDEALVALRQDVLMMGGLCEKSHGLAMNGLLGKRDDLCNIVIADDDEIDELEKQVDHLGIDILMRFQPVASDLRAVISSIRISNNLERVADKAVNIARQARKMAEAPDDEERQMFESMFREALALLRDAMKSYQAGDVKLALAIKARDKSLDQQSTEAARRLTEKMSENPNRIKDCVSLLFVSRHLERVGDHAKNIAEDAVYAAAAEDIRHPKAAALSP